MPRQAAPGGDGDPHSGRKIGKYEILTRLSVGGMAELFLAFTKGPGGFRKFVALKQILPDVKTDEFVQMFLDEARITAAFSHPNIGQVFDLGLEDDELYLAMEFLPGQNLEQVLIAASRMRPLPIGFAARVARDVCLGLHYAHHFTAPSGRKVAVVHRDMAPRNVMITYDGVVKVIDFGIAKAKGRIARTHVGMVKGTSGYMSPEQVRGQELDGRSDLFTAGVLLHEMLCGRRLFDTSNEDAMMRQIANADVPPPRSLNPDVPEALNAVVVRALAKDPARRFATGREMAKAIEVAVGPEIFDEEAVAELMQALFADKRLKTLALLDQPINDDERVSRIIEALREPKTEDQTVEAVLIEDELSDVRPTLPMIKLPAAQQPPRPPPVRASSASTRLASPPNARPFPAAPRSRNGSSPRRQQRPLQEDAPTQIGPMPGMMEHSDSSEPEARDSRRSPRVGMFTLGKDESPQGEALGPKRLDDDGESATSEISHASRATQAWGALSSPARKGLWVVLTMVVMGLAVLFMPEPLRSRFGAVFASASRWASERISRPEPQPQPQAEPQPEPQPQPQAEPQPQPPSPDPVVGSGTTLPPKDVYEPPPPAEAAGSEKPPEQPSAPVLPSPTSPSLSTKPAGTRTRKLDSPGVRLPKSAKPATKPVPKPGEDTEDALEDAGGTEDAWEEGTPESTEEPSGKPQAPQSRPDPAEKPPAVRGKPEVLTPPKPIEDTDEETYEEPQESEASSVGPAEVDPSIQPVEIYPPPLEGELR